MVASRAIAHGLSEEPLMRITRAKRPLKKNQKIIVIKFRKKELINISI